MEGMLNLCGLWSGKDKNGDEYLSGKLTYSSRICIFKNKYKKTDKDPDYLIRLCKAEPKKEEEVGNVPF
jgi:hypothetical protein